MFVVAGLDDAVGVVPDRCFVAEEAEGAAAQVGDAPAEAECDDGGGQPRDQDLPLHDGPLSP